MKYRILGEDLKVSEIGLGCMGFSHAYGAPTEKKEAVRLIEQAVNISLAWMLCKKPYLVPIPGSRKERRLMENAGASKIVLTTSEVKALDEALDSMEMSAVFGGSKVIEN